MNTKHSKPAAYQVVNKFGGHVAFDDNLVLAKDLCRLEGDHIVPLYAAASKQNAVVPAGILVKVFNKSQTLPFATNPDGSVDMIVYIEWLQKTWLDGMKAAEEALAYCHISNKK